MTWVRVRSAHLWHALERERQQGRHAVGDTLCGWLALRPFESSESPPEERRCPVCVARQQPRLPLGNGP
jgi:hypothetical protein